MNAILNHPFLQRVNQGLAADAPARRQPCNLLRHGYEEVAARIQRRILSSGQPQIVEVDDDCDVLMSSAIDANPRTLTARMQAPGYVGTYSRTALAEHIEDDLLHWLRTAGRPA